MSTQPWPHEALLTTVLQLGIKIGHIRNCQTHFALSHKDFLQFFSFFVYICIFLFPLLLQSSQSFLSFNAQNHFWKSLVSHKRSAIPRCVCQPAPSFTWTLWECVDHMEHCALLSRWPSQPTLTHVIIVTIVIIGTIWRQAPLWTFLENGTTVESEFNRTGWPCLSLQRENGS